MVLLAQSFSFADTVRLFKASGEPVNNYEERAISLQPGDTVVFSNGKKVVIKQALGNGFASLVYETADGKVLRIASATEYIEMNADYLKGFISLRNEGTPVVQVFENESLPSEYLLVEKVNFRFTLEDLIKSNRNYSDATRERLFQSLLLFADRVAQYHTIGDFHPGQLVFDGNKWLLLDFSNDHEMSKSKRSRTTVFDGFTEDQIQDLEKFFGDNAFDSLKKKTYEARIRGPRLMCRKLFAN